MRANTRHRLAAAMLVLFSIACGRQPATTPTVRIGHFPNLTHAPALLARADGEFERALAPAKVEWQLFTAGPSAIEAIFAGELDLLYVGPGPAINGWVKSEGRALRVLAGSTQGGAGLVVTAASGIRAPADLAGRRVGTPQLGNTQDIALRSWLGQAGLAPIERGGNVHVVPIAPADQLTLLARGELDGAWAVEPWLSRMQVEAGARLILDEATLYPDGRYPTTLLAVRRDWLESHPELAAQALAVHRGAIAQLADPAARTRVEALLGRLVGQSLGRQVLDSAWAALRFDADPLGEVLARHAAEATRLGFLPEGSDLHGMVVAP